jgi:hypothetical protein
MITEKEYLEAKKITDEYEEQLNIPFVIKSFSEMFGDFPTVYIERNGKRLTQQRAKKEDLLEHLVDKYPDWEIVESNF